MVHRNRTLSNSSQENHSRMLCIQVPHITCTTRRLLQFLLCKTFSLLYFREDFVSVCPTCS
ncbi:hypothetical protein Hanom_Chr12g01122631 [Helianthus anomalus]